jgi:hypothetical protein
MKISKQQSLPLSILLKQTMLCQKLVYKTYKMPSQPCQTMPCWHLYYWQAITVCQSLPSTKCCCVLVLILPTATSCLMLSLSSFSSNTQTSKEFLKRVNSPLTKVFAISNQSLENLLMRRPLKTATRKLLLLSL